MKVLIDIVHPADVLFFKRPMERLSARGDEVLVLSREKDVANALLDQFAAPYRTISRAGRGLFGLAGELLKRDWSVIKAAREFEPDVMTGFGGVAVSHAGALLRIPSCAFYDSENASLQTRLTWPFINHLTAPASYRGVTPKGRTALVRGVKELSYFHPSHFKADPERAKAAGWQPDTDNFLIRIVDWRANHDQGKSGLDQALLRTIVDKLAGLGVLHISSETALPEALRQYEYKGTPADLHHLMAHCRLMVGESATMASECAILGTPAIYAGQDFPGYVHELEAANLIMNVLPGERTLLPAKIDEMLASGPDEYRKARDAYVASCPDWADVIMETLDRFGSGTP
ncbi:MAG: DUF354 domain-containing protein [Pseudomonadota bacterium]